MHILPSTKDTHAKASAIVDTPGEHTDTSKGAADGLGLSTRSATFISAKILHIPQRDT
jgi:hypothetical protein